MKGPMATRAPLLKTVYLRYPELKLTAEATPRVVAIGMFDGVHRGHQAVLQAARAIADREGLPLAVFTFVGHPRSVLRPDYPVPLLCTWNEKQRKLEEAGTDVLIGAHFTPDFAALSPTEFAQRILVEQLGARHVVVGYNFAFGHQQAGSVATLEALGPEMGFGVTAISALHLAEAPVSSSRIRKLLAKGQIEEANHLLGGSYEITGTVVLGDQRGRTLGFPTANLEVPASKLLPAYGVYAGTAHWQDQERVSVVNLGMRPTFDPPQLRLEAHLLDFMGDLYGAELTLRLKFRLRPERAFSGVDELVAQIHQDVQRARGLASEHAPGGV